MGSAFIYCIVVSACTVGAACYKLLRQAEEPERTRSLDPEAVHLSSFIVQTSLTTTKSLRQCKRSITYKLDTVKRATFDLKLSSCTSAFRTFTPTIVESGSNPASSAPLLSLRTYWKAFMKVVSNQPSNVGTSFRFSSSLVRRMYKSGTILQ